jgi:cell division protein FtsW (lipid II flippase)
VKIQDWVIFISALLSGIGLFPFFLVKALSSGALIDWAWCIFWLGLAGFGLHISFSKEAYEKYKRQQTRQKIVQKKAYGHFAPVAPYGGLILMIFAAVCAKCFPNHLWITYFFLLLAVIYSVWLLVFNIKHKKGIDYSGEDGQKNK